MSSNCLLKEDANTVGIASPFPWPVLMLYALRLSTG